ARAPAVALSAAPPRRSRSPVSAATLPRLLSSPAQSGFRRRAGRLRDPAPAVLCARAPAAAQPRHSRPLDSAEKLPLVGKRPRRPSPTTPFGFRSRAAGRQDPARATRPDRAPARDVAATRCRVLQRQARGTVTLPSRVAVP